MKTRFFLLLVVALRNAARVLAQDCDWDANMEAYGTWIYPPGSSVFVPCPLDESTHCNVEGNLINPAGGWFNPQMLPRGGGGENLGLFKPPWLPAGGGAGDEDCCGADGGGPTGPQGGEVWAPTGVPGGCCGGGGDGDWMSMRGVPYGMATWSVTEPIPGLWLHDVPVWYQPGRGPRLEFKLSYKHLKGDTVLQNVFGFGPRWAANFRSYATPHPTHTNHVVISHGDGSTVAYNLKVNNDYYSRARITALANGGYILSFAGGSELEFASAYAVGGLTRFFLSRVYRAWDEGNPVSFTYRQTNDIVFLDRITDATGKQTTFDYTNAGSYYPALIARITVPTGQSASFAYDTNGLLTNIVDAAGNSSGFVYAGAKGIHQLLTPYGTTTFIHSNTTSWRALCVDEVGLRKHLFLYLPHDTEGRVPTGYTNEVPDTGSLTYTNTFETNNLNLRNSFYWSPRQFDLLSANVWSNLTNGTFAPS